MMYVIMLILEAFLVFLGHLGVLVLRNCNSEGRSGREWRPQSRGWGSGPGHHSAPLEEAPGGGHPDLLTHNPGEPIGRARVTHGPPHCPRSLKPNRFQLVWKTVATKPQVEAEPQGMAWASRLQFASTGSFLYFLLLLISTSGSLCLQVTH